MSRPVTLFTGQWADLSFGEICKLAKQMGYDGLEPACWGDHFDVNAAAGISLADFMAGKTPDKEAGRRYCAGRWEILASHGLTAFVASAHLVGQAVCDVISTDHKAILPPEVWGKGVDVDPGEPGYDPDEAEAIRKRAAAQLQISGLAVRNLVDAKPKGGSDWGRDVATLNGFTGSKIWRSIYSFPPVSPAKIAAGFQDFGTRFIPILDFFKSIGVRFALEVHPTEIAFGIASAQRAVKAVNDHPSFGFNYDPSHLIYQHVDYVKFIRTFPGRIFHVHMKDAQVGHGDGTVGVFGDHTEFADHRRYWDFRSLGHGDVNFDQIIVALNDSGYAGPLSVEWEDIRMNRIAGGTEASAFVRKVDFAPSDVRFDAAFDKEKQA